MPSISAVLLIVGFCSFFASSRETAGMSASYRPSDHVKLYENVYDTSFFFCRCRRPPLTPGAPFADIPTGMF